MSTLALQERTKRLSVCGQGKPRTVRQVQKFLKRVTLNPRKIIAMMLFAVVLLTTATSCVCAVRPGFKTRITQHALDYGKWPLGSYCCTNSACWLSRKNKLLPLGHNHYFDYSASILYWLDTSARVQRRWNHYCINVLNISINIIWLVQLKVTGDWDSSVGSALDSRSGRRIFFSMI